MTYLGHLRSSCQLLRQRHKKKKRIIGVKGMKSAHESCTVSDESEIVHLRACAYSFSAKLIIRYVECESQHISHCHGITSRTLVAALRTPGGQEAREHFTAKCFMVPGNEGTVCTSPRRPYSVKKKRTSGYYWKLLLTVIHPSRFPFGRFPQHFLDIRNVFFSSLK